MCDNELDVGSCKHPLGIRVWHGLRESTAMRRPGQDCLHLLVFKGELVRVSVSVRQIVVACPGLFHSDQVGKSLQRMHCSCLHGKDRLAAVCKELVEYSFCIIVITVGETGKRAHSDDIAV